MTPLIPEADIVDSKGQPLNESSLTDELINTEMILSQWGGFKDDQSY